MPVSSICGAPQLVNIQPPRGITTNIKTARPEFLALFFVSKNPVNQLCFVLILGGISLEVSACFFSSVLPDDCSLKRINEIERYF